MAKSKAIIPESPLLILPALAVKIGLNEAVILQQMHFYLLTSKHFYDDKKWIYNTYSNWQKQFPFWSISTIKRAITNLEEKGMIISGNFNKFKMDKTKWYSINYDNIPDIEIEDSEEEKKQDATSNGSNCPHPHEVKLTPCIPESSENTNKDIYIPEKEKSSNNINEELINKVLTTWNNQQHLTTHKLSTVIRKFQKKHIDAIRDIGLEKVDKSIANYGKIVGDPNMWYTWHFSLWDFIGRSLENFLDEAKPFDNFKITKQSFEEEKPYYDPYAHPERERERMDDIDV